MSTLYPAARDDGTTLPNPLSTNFTNNPDHASLHGNANDAVKAIETKLGTGSSTPASTFLLRGTGAGTSAWDKAAPTGDILGTTDAQAVSNKTITGGTITGATIANPTLTVDAINEYTASNGVTVAGLNVKSSKLNTSNSVVTSNITNAAVTADKLGTGATAALVATSETTTSTSYADLATVTDTVTVTIGANGLALVNLYASMANSGANNSFITFQISGATTLAAADNYSMTNNVAAAQRTSATFLVTALNAGSTTFKMKYKVSAGTGTFLDRRISVIPL